MPRRGGQLVERADLDVEVARLAATQEALVSTAQLREIGVTDRAVEVRVRRGGLHRVHRGVYVVGVRRLTPRGRLWAAVLACGGPERAAISHGTAAADWRIRQRWPSCVDVTTLGRGGSRRGVRVHTSVTLDAQRDVTRRHGLPITLPSRTLVDLAPGLTRHALERACHEAAFLGLLDLDDIARRLDAAPPGASNLRHAVATVLRHGPQITKSKLEERFLALVARHDLPAPLVNAPLLGYTVDFLWPEHRLVVETDGRNHLRPATYDADRERDTVLQLHGFRVVRFTSSQLTDRAAGTVSRLLAA